MIRIFLLLLAISLSATIPSQGLAQSLAGLGGVAMPGASESDAQAEGGVIADAVRAAADTGVSVVVIDADGNLITSVPARTKTPVPGDAAQPGGSVLMQGQERADQFRETLRERLSQLPNSINEVAFILRATSPDGTIGAYVKTLVFSLLLFGVGYLFARYVYGPRLARRFVVSRVKEHPKGYSDKMPFLVFRFFMGIIGTLLTMLLAYILGTLLFDPVNDLSLQITITAINVAFFASRTVSDVWRMILSPYLSQYRIPHFSDRAARRLYLWATAIATYEITVIISSTWLADFGLNYNVYAIYYGASALIGVLANIALVLVNRRAISTAILNGRPPDAVSRVQRFLSVAWLPAVAVYFIFGWLELAVDLVMDLPTSIPLSAGAYVVLLSIIVVYGVINYLIERYFERARHLKLMQRGDEDDADAAGKGAETGHSASAIHTFEDLARRVSGIIAFVAGSAMLLWLWNGDSMVMNDGPIDRALDVVVVLFIGYVIYHAFRIWIDTKIAEEAADAPEQELGDEGGAASSASRLATLLPLFRNVILIVVIVTIVLIVLLEMGVNVSPLFAGAGVVGIAVGFGAQTLVRDIFSGAFFLFDDAFRKGEYIDIGSVKGTVEKISVRSFQLRHHLGALHTIPFGEIQVLTNFSRDWVIMKLKLRLTYDTDVERVRKLIKKLGQELLEDPVIGENFIQPLKSQGVIEMQDSAMIVRVKFMTKPGDQWLVRKRVYQDIRELFAREGIKFAHREVTVRLAEEPQKPLSPAQKEAVLAGAEAAMEEDALEGGSQGDDR